jgi:hypothetical protein
MTDFPIERMQPGPRAFENQHFKKMPLIIIRNAPFFIVVRAINLIRRPGTSLL